MASVLGLGFLCFIYRVDLLPKGRIENDRCGRHYLTVNASSFVDIVEYMSYATEWVD